MGWKQHRNKLYNILFVSPAWLLCCYFSGAGSRSSEPIPAAPATGARSNSGSGALPRKAQSVPGATALPGARAAAEQSSALLQGSIINSSTAAIHPERENPALPPCSAPAPLGACCLLAHRDKQLLLCPASQSSRINPLRTNSHSIRCTHI